MLNDIIKIVNILNKKNKSYLRLFVFIFLLSVLCIGSINSNNFKSLFQLLKNIKLFGFLFYNVFLKIYIFFSIVIVILLFLNSIFRNDQIERLTKKVDFNISKEIREYDKNKVLKSEKKLALGEKYKKELEDMNLYIEGNLVSLIDALNMIIVVAILVLYIFKIKTDLPCFIVVDLFLYILFKYSIESQRPMIKAIKQIEDKIYNFESYDDMTIDNNYMVINICETFKMFMYNEFHQVLLSIFLTLIIIYSSKNATSVYVLGVVIFILFLILIVTCLLIIKFIVNIYNNNEFHKTLPSDFLRLIILLLMVIIVWSGYLLHIRIFIILFIVFMLIIKLIVFMYKKI